MLKMNPTFRYYQMAHLTFSRIFRLAISIPFLHKRVHDNHPPMDSKLVGIWNEKTMILGLTAPNVMKSPCPENDDRLSMGPHNIFGFDDTDLIYDLREFTNEPSFPQTNVSTPTMPCMGTKIDSQGDKTHDTRELAEMGFPLRRAAFPSRAVATLEASLPFLPTASKGQPLERSSDPQPNKSLIDAPIELPETIQSHEILGESSLSKTPSLPLQNSRESSTEGKALALSRFSISDLNNTKNNNNNNNNKTQSPLLVVIEDTNDTQQEVQEFLANANQPSKARTGRSSSDSSSRKVATTWEHTFVPKSHFTEAGSESPPKRMSGNPPKRPVQKLVGRTRPLPEDTRARAKEMRKIRSCLRCKVSKIACTPGEICEPCLRVQALAFSGKICFRANLKDYLNLFLPEQAVRPFQRASIDQLVEKNISGYSDSQVEVYLSSGPCYPPIKVTVGRFHTKDRCDPSFSAVKKIVPIGMSRKLSFVEFYSPPLGITNFNQDLESKLMNHIQHIAEGKRNYGEVSYGYISRLTWDVYEAVRCYQLANLRNQLLRKALILYAMQYFMTKTIVLLPEESKEALKHLPAPNEINTQKPNLRMINIQIKHVMFHLLRGTYIEVLDELEKGLRSKDLKVWAPIFCCILILCMCAEMVQITSDHRVVCALDEMSKSRDGKDKNGHKASRDDSFDVCRKLDDLPIASAQSSFHVIYKTIKLKDGSKREQGFNPVRDGLDAVRKAELGLDVEGFVGRILDVVAKHKNKLNHEATIPSLNRLQDDFLEDHSIFRKHNSGRLVSIFLQSML
ncbi:hypothetical protein NA56DRAFT_125772 [Hyaloscypha hepaticicola]|uniref:Uncharacterized protein n=1 Tax=Hyaloscypha hepaticicola TaxID=2082293 RepID=A0A2J6Q507_9HELO|nr:hypothetical protein NA56DRAFT_125772 [Hyaloscypha hepaticicola]